MLQPMVVDYSSGATFLIPRDLFLQAGGFDLAYEPSYYEDTDLCFK
jgi:GT2 family glycosyltransferase